MIPNPHCLYKSDLVAVYSGDSLQKCDMWMRVNNREIGRIPAWVWALQLLLLNVKSLVETTQALMIMNFKVKVLNQDIVQDCGTHLLHQGNLVLIKHWMFSRTLGSVSDKITLLGDGRDPKQKHLLPENFIKDFVAQVICKFRPACRIRVRRCPGGGGRRREAQAAPRTGWGVGRTKYTSGLLSFFIFVT